MIAHRLSTIESADQVVVLEQGRLVEMGAHDKLLANDAAYARLYRTQFDDSSNTSEEHLPG